MDKIFKNFFRKGKKISLLYEEKTRIRGALLSYINSYPAKENKRPVGALARLFIFPAPILRLAPVASLCLILLVGIGAAAAAEGSLPGDILYPVKIHGTENARSLLSFSKERKAEWEIERADKRLKEIEKLAAKGQLEAGLAAQAEARFKNHTDLAANIARELKEKNHGRDAAKIQSDLKTVLIVHEDVLERIKSYGGRAGRGGGENEVEREVENLHGEVKRQVRDVAKSLNEAEKDIKSSSGHDIQRAAEGKLNSAENKLAEVGKFIAEKERRTDDKIIEEARKLLAQAEDAIGKGKVKMGAKDYGEAFVLFQKSIRFSQAAQQLISIRLTLPKMDRAQSFGIEDFSEKIKSSEDEARDNNGHNTGNGSRNGESSNFGHGSEGDANGGED